VPLGKRFWPLAKEERDALSELFEAETMRAMITGLQSRDDADRSPWSMRPTG